MIVGIDESGRGPVIGPLVMCALAISEEDEQKLKELNVKDSKELTKEKRKELQPIIQKIAKSIKLRIISPQEIDKAINSMHDNLNLLEARMSAEMINEMLDEMKINKIILDCPSPNLKSYYYYILKKLKNKDINLVCEHKADKHHVVVSAASIIAKVVRDREIENIKKNYGIDFGSGYMSDPKTAEFLKKNIENYDFFRKSWVSFKIIADNKNQKKISDYR